MAKNTITVTVTREITFDIEVQVDYEYDDDGCGGPSSSGNSMTGYRGKYLVATNYSVDPVTLVKAAEDSITLDDDEITDAVNAAE
jgi:hypothetical protein